MSAKELKIKTVIISEQDGKRVERDWDEIPEWERKLISKNLTDRFMTAAGYRRDKSN